MAFDTKNNYICEVDFNINDQGFFKGMFNKSQGFLDEIAGCIYKVKPDVINGFLKSNKIHKK